MVYQGVVMEVEKSHIIVLTDNTNYLKLKKKGNSDIGKKIMFIEDDIIRKTNRSFKPLIGIAAAIILVIATIIGQFGIDFMENFQAYAIVSVDINPSLEFQIDEKEIVKKINSLNKDGREIIDDNMVGMKIEDAIILSIKKAIDKQYLNNENNVVLVSDVIIDDNAKLTTVIENEIFQKVEDDKDLQGIDLIYVDSDKEDLEKARENQVSVGKYKVYKIISNNNSDIKIEDIKNKKVSDIVKENKGLAKDEKVKTKKKAKGEKDNEKEHGKGEKGIKGKEIDVKKDKEKKYKEKEHKEIKSENKKNKGKEDNHSKQNSMNNNNKNIKQNNDKGFEKKNEEDNSKENIKDDSDKNEKAKQQEKNNKDNKKDKDNDNENGNDKDKEDKAKKTNNKNKGK